jgi:Tfp pilus assembly protein PilV
MTIHSYKAEAGIAMIKTVVIISVLLIIAGIYSLLAFLSEKRSH